MAGYNTNMYYPTNTGTFSPYNYQVAVPMQQPQNNSGNIMTIFIGSEEDARQNARNLK